MQWYDLPLEGLRTYTPPLTREADFASFWQSGVEEAVRQPLNPTATRERSLFPVQIRHLAWDGYRHGRLHGRLVIPTGAGPFPAVVLLHGYNWHGAGLYDGLAWAGAGVASLSMDVRGQDARSPDTSPHAKTFSSWLTQSLEDRDAYYYRYVYLDCLRGLIALRDQPDIDPKRTAVVGSSQGGALALAVAALDGSVRQATAGAPFMAHIRRAVALQLDPPYDELARWFQLRDPLHEREASVYRTLSYFDVMNFAPDIHVPVVVGVGLLDRTCPPSTAFACANHMAGGATTLVYPEAGHDLPPAFRDDTMARVVKALA